MLQRGREGRPAVGAAGVVRADRIQDQGGGAAEVVGGGLDSGGREEDDLGC